jgi:hypothetical protein
MLSFLDEEDDQDGSPESAYELPAGIDKVDGPIKGLPGGPPIGVRKRFTVSLLTTFERLTEMLEELRGDSPGLDEVLRKG